MTKITLLLTSFVFAIGAFAQEGSNCSKEVLEGGDTAWGNPHVYIYMLVTLEWKQTNHSF